MTQVADKEEQRKGIRFSVNLYFLFHFIQENPASPFSALDS